MTTFPLGRPARIAVLASGRGTNLQALLQAFPPDEPLGAIRLVISNRAGAAALDRARETGVEALHLPYGDGETFAAAASSALERAGIDLVCLAGFMRILPPSFVRRYRGRLLNIHPSLLPAFRGLHAQRQALEAGATESGCTVHFVDEGVDTGAVILQRRVRVLEHDTEASLAERIRHEEHRAFPEAVRRVLNGHAIPTPEEVRP